MNTLKRWLAAALVALLVITVASPPIFNVMAADEVPESTVSSSVPEDDTGDDATIPPASTPEPAATPVPPASSATPDIAAAPQSPTPGSAGIQQAGPFTVQFYDWDGTPIGSPQTIVEGEAAVAPPDPSRTGWRFTGWDKTFDAVTENLDITAQYVALVNYTVTINYVFADSTIARQPVIFSVESGGSLSQTVASPAIAGYMPDKASVVIALLNIAANEVYTVTYTPSDGTAYKVQHYKQNLVLANTANPMDPSNFTLADTDNLTGQTGAAVTAAAKTYEGFTAPTVLPTAHIAADGSTTMRVFYTRNQYAIYFDSSGGSYVAPISALFGAPVTAPANPTRSGYTFAGWRLGGSAATVPTAMPSADLTLTASWTATGTVGYTVVYWLENITSTGYDYVGTTAGTGAAGSAPTVPGSPGVTFPIPTGRFVLNSTKTNAEKPSAINGDGTTILNVYYDRNSYTVNFVFSATKYTVAAGGTTYTASPYQLTAKYGASINAKWPANPVLKSGQSSDGNFTGWQGSNDLYVTTQYFLDEGLVTGSPLTATFDRQTRNVTVYYMFQNLTGGGYTSQYTQTVAVDRDTNTWNAKTFDGFTVQQSTVSITSSNTATFNYTRNQYKITYYNGGVIDSTSANIPYQAPLSGTSYNYTPSRPASVPAGYTFAGWYTTPQGYDSSRFVFAGATMPAYNLILYARWDKPTYTATFVPDNGTASFTQTVALLGTLTEPAAPTKAGYVFGGWYLSGAATKYVFNFPVTQNLTLTARWVAANNITYDVIYMRGGVEYQRQSFGGHVMGESVTASAITIPGYLPDALSKSITLAASGNQIVFNYSPFTAVGYTVRYRLAGDTSVQLKPDKTATTAQASITENYENVPGYYPDYYQQTLQLTPDASANTITFLYTPNAPVNYTVRTFMERIDGGYDVTEEVKQAPAGSTVTEPTPAVTGFTYQPSLSTNGRVVASNGSTILRLYYNRNQFTVTFQAGANGTLSGQTSFSAIRYGTPLATAATVPAAVPSPGYAFTGWTPSTFDDPVTKSSTYTANFEKDDSQWVAISYSANGGTGTMPDSENLLIGSSFTLPANTFTRDNFAYTNWNTAPDGTGTAYGDEETITVPGGVTLYAQWSEDETWGVTYLPGGGTGGPIIDPNRYYDDDEVTVLPSTFTRPGYKFVEWQEQGTTNTFQPGGTFGIERDMILKAVWALDDEQWATINYDKNNDDATGSMAPETVLVGVAHPLRPNTYTLANHAFGGWNTLANGSGTPYADAADYTPAAYGPATLYAQWTENSRYTITYHSNNAAAETTADGPAYTGSTRTVFPANTFTYLHHDFVRWNTTEDGTGVTYLPGDSLALTANMDLYAVWHEREAYTITYQDGIPGSTDEVSHVEYADADGFLDLTVADNLFLYPGHQFVDWVDQDGTHANPGAVIYDLFSDITFTAQWQASQYNITYQLNGGTVNGVNPTQYTVETPTFTLVNPTKPGYTFDGWTGTGLDSTTLGVTIAQGAKGDRAYTANWTRDESQWVKILFVNSNAAQGSLSGNLQFEGITGQPVTAVSLPQVTPLGEYRFSHWSAPVPATYPDADLTITAYWVDETRIPISSSSSSSSSSSGPVDSSSSSSETSSSSSSASDPSSDSSSGSSSSGGSSTGGSTASSDDTSTSAVSSAASASRSRSTTGTGTALRTLPAGVSSSRAASASSASNNTPQQAAVPDPGNGGDGGSAVTATPSTPQATWALLNLIAAIAGLVLSVALLVAALRRRTQPATGGSTLLRILSIAVGPILAVIFLLTQNLGGQMIWADMWTLLMAGLLAVQGALALLLRQMMKNRA